LEVVSVCLHIVLDGTAAAPHEAAWCRRTKKAFTLNVPSAIVRSIAFIARAGRGCPAMIASEVGYNAHVIEALPTHVAPALGWR
jgi:hypothetical protein